MIILNIIEKISLNEISSFVTKKTDFFGCISCSPYRSTWDYSTTLIMHYDGEDCLVQKGELSVTWYFCKIDRVHVSSILKPMKFGEMLKLSVHVADSVFESP